jgi:integrase
VVRDARGYSTVRGRVRRRGKPPALTEGVGLGFDGEWTRDDLKRARATVERRLDKLAALLKRDPDADPKRGRRTVREQAALWLASKEGIRGFRNYEQAIRLHVLAYPIADVRLDALGGEDVDLWLARLKRAIPDEPASVLYAFERLMQVLRDALADQDLPNLRQVLASAKRRRPRHVPTEVAPLDAAEAERLLSVLLTTPKPSGRLFAFQWATGTRYGEAAGFAWGDAHGVDWSGRAAERPTATIRQQLDRDTSKPVPTKGKRSRTVPLDELAVGVLLDLRPPNPDPAAFVFVDGRGEPIRYFDARRDLMGFTKEAQLSESGRTHVLRHSFATDLAAVAPLHVVQRLLGHRNLAMTGRYAHADDSQARDAVTRRRRSG